MYIVCASAAINCYILRLSIDFLKRPGSLEDSLKRHKKERVKSLFKKKIIAICSEVVTTSTYSFLFLAKSVPTFLVSQKKNHLLLRINVPSNKHSLFIRMEGVYLNRKKTKFRFSLKDIRNIICIVPEIYKIPFIIYL